jgi:flagellar hook protein FlgE
MMASLFAGVSGLRNHQVEMNIVGDNIANVNTIGYKSGRASFQEALVQTMRGAGRPTSSTGGTNPLQLGLGMSLSAIDNIFTQGGLETTGQITDLAIQGSGFFILSDGKQQYYTRAGAFGFDANSNMINPSNGFVVQGKMAKVDGTIPATAPVGNITLPFGQQDPARMTTQITLGMNLNSAATDSTATLASAGTSNISTVSGQALNGAGGQHVITIIGDNAHSSELSGTHALELNDVAAGDVTLTAGGANSGTLPTGNYVYTVVAVNSLGESTGQEITVNNVPANGSVNLDIHYADTDATSVKVYRRPANGTYGGALGGLVYQSNYTPPGPMNWIDDGSSAGNGAVPPSLNSTLSLTGQEVLGTNLGVTDLSGFRISVDNGSWTTLSNLTTSSTVNDLVAAINTSIPGVTASIEGGQIHIKRDFAGSPSVYNVSFQDTGTSNVAARLFGAAAFNVNNGSASTLVANDVFTPTGGTALPPQNLNIKYDAETGLGIGIEGLGGGGVTVSASYGGIVGDPDGAGPLTSSTLTIDTAETQHATSISIYDSQGGKHNVTLTFTKSYLPNQWTWKATLGGNELIRSGSSGTINFNPDGSLSSFTYDGGATQLQIDPNNGSNLMAIDLSAGTPGGFDGLTSFAAESNAAARDQNGYGMGILSNISIDPSGNITGIFTNGVSRELAQIYIAEFNNNGGLLKAGDSLFQASANSGSAISGIAGETTSSTITSGALENSNVDLAQEFTNMIVAQRGFQANARIITTSDEMLNELVSLKR